jgi:hypothetical protein
MESNAMTRMAPNTVELAGMPQRCSACFGQQHGIRHVDMDAACDRGYGNDEAVKIAYDDLILCENCVKEAAILLGMTDSQELKDSKTDLEVRLENTLKALRKAETYGESLEATLSHRPGRPEKPRRGMSDEARQTAAERMKRLHAEGKMGRKKVPV